MKGEKDKNSHTSSLKQAGRKRWTEMGADRKENGESFDSNPLHLSLPRLSNAYKKHLHSPVPFTSKGFAISIYTVSREKHVWWVLEGKSELN